MASLACLAAVSLLGGYLVNAFLEESMGRLLAVRAANHVREEWKEHGQAALPPAEGSRPAPDSFKAIGDQLRRKILARDIKVATPDGMIVWATHPLAVGTRLAPERLRRVLRDGLAYEWKIPGGAQGEGRKFSGPTFELALPIRRRAEEKAPPDLIVEVHMEEWEFLASMDRLKFRVWSITAAGGVSVLIVMLGSVYFSSRRLKRENELTRALHRQSLRMTEELRNVSINQRKLADLCLRLVSTLSFSEVCRSVVQAAVGFLEIDRARIFLRQADGRLGEEAVAGSPGLPVIRANEARRTFLSGEGMAGWIFQKGLPLRVDDVLQDPRWGERAWAERNDIHGFAGVPIRWGNEVIGAFTCLRTGRRPFTEADVDILSILAGYAAAAVQNARLHEEAARSRDFFLSVVDDNADAVIIADVEGRITHWNPGAQKMYGYSREEALGRSVELLDSGSRDVKFFRGEVLKQGRAIQIDTWRCGKGGTPVPVSLTLSPVKQADGNVIALAGIHRDISDRQRIEAERAAHIVQLRRLQELSQKIGASLALGEVLQFVVESVGEILGVPIVSLSLREGEEFVRRAEVNPFGSRGYETRRAGEGAAGWVAETKKVLYIEDVRKNLLFRNQEWAEKRGMGSYLAVPLLSGDRTIGVLSCIAQGVRKFSENEAFLLTTLANSAAIAIQNAERHRQLEEALGQVKRSKEIADRAEKLSSLAVLAEGAAHELLNPANIISLHAQRMQWESEEGSQPRKSAEVILRNVKRISDICEALRQFSQEKAPSRRLIEPNALVRDAMRPLEPELRLHNIVEELELMTPLRIFGDPSELRAALLHLMRNAMDAMPGGGRLRVSTREVRENGRRWWEACISDTGDGIPASILPRIFDPFFTTKPPNKGSGLGLSVTHGIVERHGGKLWAESHAGKGAAFFLRLPAEEEA